MNFDIKNLFSIKIGSLEIWFTETHLYTWIIMGVLMLFAIVVRVNLKKFKDIPKGLQNVAEALIETFDNFARGIVGEKMMDLGNWFFMAFAFILISNISGLFFMRNPTADWSMTFTLAITTFVLIQVYGTKYNGIGHWKSFIEPNILFSPLNIIGELARPIALSFRLFGNIVAGMILMTLLYQPIFTKFIIPVPLHIYFDLFSGAIQAYVFIVLSMSFIGAAGATEE